MMIDIPDLSEKDIKRFWENIDKKSNDECWVWKAHKSTKGYGKITIKNKTYKTHRVSWVIHNRQALNGLCVCHTCDNPACVNPSHLFLGTNKDNIQDMYEKGREAHNEGENNGNHKLTAEQVAKIREKYIPRKYSTRMLAKEFNVSKSVVHSVVSHTTWKHVAHSN